MSRRRWLGEDECCEGAQFQFLESLSAAVLRICELRVQGGRTAVGGVVRVVVTADGRGQDADDVGTAGGEGEHLRPAAADHQRRARPLDRHDR